MIHKSSREVGIDTENDEWRAKCAGKLGTLIKIDPGDQSVEVHVIVSPGRVDEMRFGLRALEPVSNDHEALGKVFRGDQKKASYPDVMLSKSRWFFSCFTFLCH